ncbi:hypothetical protein BH09VER1_BH09VER1_21760 [soil metagenome]
MGNWFPVPAFYAIIALLSLVGSASAQIENPQLGIVSGNYSGTTFDSITFVNDVVGARIFYNSGYFGESEVIANVEGGYIWDGHEVFDRTVFSGSNAVTTFVSDPSVTAEYDFHATMVGHVLAGAGHVTGTNGTDLSILGAGMAPFAELWSGAIATSFSSSDIGSFETTKESTLTPYKTFFRGGTSTAGRKADVINSSWGGSDPAGTSTEILTIDALARENASVAFVVAAGNSGTGTVSAPGSGYNGITVGSLGGTDFLTPSNFSSSGPTDFYNPATDQTISGVRHSVDISAPGELMALAAYLGSTGSLRGTTYTQDPSPTDQYFLNEDGTSFATPIVAGGIGLLKDAAKGPAYAYGPEAFDTRVIKSVLMAGSRRTTGWNNGQTTGLDGVIRTTQALDIAAGAGALDLTGAAEVYFGIAQDPLLSTRDVAGLGGGSITSAGWDYGAVSYDRTSGIGQSNDYTFDTSFSTDIELTISLNWFAGRTIDVNDLGADLSFSNLNLELWLVVDGVFVREVAESATIYDNTEFLRVDLTEAGTYGLRVTFLGLVYDLSPETTATENYGLAWQSQTVPEPGTIALLVAALTFLIIRGRSLRVR